MWVGSARVLLVRRLFLDLQKVILQSSYAASRMRQLTRRHSLFDSQSSQQVLHLIGCYQSRFHALLKQQLRTVVPANQPVCPWHTSQTSRWGLMWVHYNAVTHELAPESRPARRPSREQYGAEFFDLISKIWRNCRPVPRAGSAMNHFTRAVRSAMMSNSKAQQFPVHPCPFIDRASFRNLCASGKSSGGGPQLPSQSKL